MTLPTSKGTSDDEPHLWTTWRGIQRAVVWGGLAAIVWIALLAVPTWYVPGVVLNVWIRFALAFAVTWGLFAVIHRAAGMAGMACTAIVVAYATIVLISQHPILAIHGMPTNNGMVSGWSWCGKEALLLVNGIPIIGLAFAVTLCHDGGSILRTVADILSTRIRG